MAEKTPQVAEYTGDAIRTLEWQEHIRLRPGMYIGKLGKGKSPDDGIYVLIKEVVDNSIDEHMMGFGKVIDIDVSDEGRVTIRDYGRGVPLDKVVDVASKMNTGAKYDSKVFKKSVGLNGVGIKAVNALSEYFSIQAFRDGQTQAVEFSRGILVNKAPLELSDEPNGTAIVFEPDRTIFDNFRFRMDFIVNLVKNYAYLNTGLNIMLNGVKYSSRHGLKDLLNDQMSNEPLYPIIHLKGEDIEIAMTHANQYGEEYHTYVNGQHTTQGGTHQVAFREAVARTIREHFNKSFDLSDIRNGMIAAVSVKVEEPVFESQTKTKLGSRDIGPNGPTVRQFILDFLKSELDNFLHKNQDYAEILNKKILSSERERKAIAGVKKIARERAKKSNLHNKKLRDCRVHLDDKKGDRRSESCIFITEGDSASGSITKSRDVNTQAVFSLRGKPLNSFGLTQKVVYENEEFNLLQAALNIEDGLDGLRYDKIIVATDADVDGMHIRLLLMTFFLQFFPELVRKGHVYILQTPLFRVRNKKKTIYCYSEEERIAALEEIKDAEITRFKGLGEISPDEFKHFIGEDIRLDQVHLEAKEHISDLLSFYMGKNTPDRQEFIIENLVVVEDDVE